MNSHLRELTQHNGYVQAVGKSGSLPHLYSARVHVDLILGYFTSFLYWVRTCHWTA